MLLSVRPFVCLLLKKLSLFKGSQEGQKAYFTWFCLPAAGLEESGKHVIHCLPLSTVHGFSYANAALCQPEEIAINQLSIGRKKKTKKDKDRAAFPSLLVLPGGLWGSGESLAPGFGSGV